VIEEGPNSLYVAIAVQCVVVFSTRCIIDVSAILEEETSGLTHVLAVGWFTSSISGVMVKDTAQF
jgi:dimeric dUTPase (all-alpha-NTP-PPase superfamily)